MTDLDLLADVADAKMVFDRFGQWPTFHDAEVISLQLSRDGPSLVIEIYVFQTTRESDLRGYFRRANESRITFLFDDVEDLSLADFNHQNVLAGLRLCRGSDLIEVWIDPLFGLTGHFLCKRMKVISVVAVETTQAV